MTSKILLHRTPDHIVTLTFNRPEVRNALDWEAQTYFLEIVRGLASDPTVRAVILTGTGDKAFCAGGDLAELAAYPSEADGARLGAIMGEALDLLENAPFPSIAAINGHALGGGTEIALACDLRFMSMDAHFSMVQVRLGLTPGWGAGQRLLRLVGYSRAMTMLLAGHVYEAVELLDMGLLVGITHPDETLSAAMELAETIARLDSAAVAAVKRILRGGLTLPYDEAKAAERAAFPKLWAAEPHLKAVEAFLKRKHNAT
jgi:enoyl-CoA hydratase